MTEKHLSTLPRNNQVKRGLSTDSSEISQHPSPVVCDIPIRQDTHGRFSLNDLHLASGGEKRHGPSYFLANDSTKSLISEIEKDTTGNPVVTIEGKNGGTYVRIEIVYAYAMWISASFNLKVIRAYHAIAAKGREQQQRPLSTMEMVIASAQAVMRLEQVQEVIEKKLEYLTEKVDDPNRPSVIIHEHYIHQPDDPYYSQGYKRGGKKR